MNRTYTIVQTLLRHGEAGFSRNKNFEAYREPEVQRAVKIFRHLRSVRNDLLRVGEGATYLAHPPLPVKGPTSTMSLWTVTARPSGPTCSTWPCNAA